MPEKLSRNTIASQMKVATEAVGPWRFQVLYTLFDLGVFHELDRGESDCRTLSARIDVPEEALRRLLDCAAALEFLEKEGDTYRNAPFAGETLVEGKPGYLGNWLALTGRWYHSFGKLSDGIRRNRSVEDANFSDDPNYRELFVKGMIDYARYRGSDILNHLDLTGCRRLLDVGCGPGVYPVMFCERYPDLECVCLDLPHAVAIAENYVAEHRLEDRITFVSVDYRKAVSFGTGYDVVFLSHVLHQEEEAVCLELVKRCCDTLNSNGILAVQAMFPDGKGIPAASTALHDLLAFLIFPGGKNHTSQSVVEWLEAAGLEDVRYIPMSLLNVNSLVVGRKP